MTIDFSRRDFIKKTAAASAIAALAPAFTFANSNREKVFLGIDVLAKNDYRRIQHKRIGLLTHPAGVNRFGVSTIELLVKHPKVKVTALFGPEHGIYGNEKANVPVEDRIDPATSLPVFSLYGKFRRPTPAMLDNIDIMLVDLQDIGSRSYTYISCMKYVIEEAFKHDKEVIVLDRPNPLGGLKIDGPPLEEKWMSYVGAFQFPYVHGLTIGEIAMYAYKTPGVLDVSESVRKKAKLTVIPMEGWRRYYLWPDTGLDWVETSPAIPDVSAAAGYPMTGLGTQLGSFSHGYGTRYPFRLIQFPGLSPESIAATFQKMKIPGLDFRILSFQHHGNTRRATYITLTDWQAVSPTELSLHMMAQACEWEKNNPFIAASDSAQGLFLKHLGDSRVLKSLQTNGRNLPIATFLNDWKKTNDDFARMIRRYYLYS